MKVLIFTIRNKKTKELIYVEGTQGHNEYVSFFSLEPQWLSEEDLNLRNQCWHFYQHKNSYSFKEEIRHLFDYQYDLIQFALEEIEVK